MSYHGHGHGMGRDTRKDDDAAPRRRTSYTIKLTDEQIQALGEWCSRHLWVPFPVEYAVFAYKDERVNVTAYNSGKVVVAGRDTENFVTNVLEPQITKEARLGYDEVLHPDWFEDHAGLDESGKGDLFGPLVTACVIATGGMISAWRDSGVRDSKTVTSDSAIFAIEKKIRQTPGVIVKVMFTDMVKYNRLYHEFGDNLNKMLAWYHASALEDCLPRFESEHGKPCPRGLLDQFTETPLVQRELKKRGIAFNLDMRTKAESDPVVAAASIVARAAYVRELVKLSRLAGERLPKGSGAPAKEAGLRIVEKFGPAAFGRFAKLHFRTAWECQGLEPPRPKFVFRRKSKSAGPA
ncbi:MAG: ribonuclease HIII [Puniceicoccales bacterium]|jgi:ribonuclease HIII|nr:ribonuclease HIII [Puniceicoccales bacterium]